MRQSHNEIEALVLKAARGADFDWGMAREVALAARWLYTFQPSALSAVAQWLDFLDGQLHAHYCIKECSSSWVSAQHTLCPIMTGVSLMDFCHEWSNANSLSIHHVNVPILLLPFAARVSTSLRKKLTLHGLGVPCKFINGQLCQLDESQWNKLIDTATIAEISVHLSVPGDEEHVLQVGLEDPRIHQSVLDQLSLLAHRTYAPASEESRRLGAGD